MIRVCCWGSESEKSAQKLAFLRRDLGTIGLGSHIHQRHRARREKRRLIEYRGDCACVESVPKPTPRRHPVGFHINDDSHLPRSWCNGLLTGQCLPVLGCVSMRCCKCGSSCSSRTAIKRIPTRIPASAGHARTSYHGSKRTAAPFVVSLVLPSLRQLPAVLSGNRPDYVS
jgi:hypothetical protein